MSGWSLEFIVWHLPLPIGLQLRHVSIYVQGAITTRPLPIGEKVDAADFDLLLAADRALDPPPTPPENL